MYLINQYYKNKYNTQVELVSDKLKYISELLDKITKNNTS